MSAPEGNELPYKDGGHTLDQEKGHSIPSSGDELSDDGTQSEMLAGVKKVEAISTAWSKWGLIVAYIS
jgi:hypothetical protein